jgi:hypothetical protein
MPTLPFHFGDWTPPPALASIDGTSVSWIANHGDDGVALLLSQFKNKPRIEAFLRAVLAGVQDLDDGIFQVLIGIWIDGAEGVQLDGIGEILDLPRGGWTDSTYRTFLRAQILVYRSLGTWPDTAGILRVIGVTLALATFDEPGIAAARVILGELLLAPLLAADVFRVCAAAKPASVRFTLEFPTVDVAESFTWADADVVQPDALRGWSDDVLDIGGRWADELTTSEAA